MPLLLAIGHEFLLGSYLGPPLAFWLGEIAFRIAGAFGLYALAQACIVVAYWAVFTLGRSIVGTRHAVLAVLLMVGIAAFTVPSPNFGPAVLAAPFWALALLHYWRAVGEGERGYWFLLALDLGLLAARELCRADPDRAAASASRWAATRGRASLLDPEPWLALLLFAIVIFPHLAWLKGARDLVVSGLTESRAAGALAARRLALRGAGAEPSRPRPAGRLRQRLAAAPPRGRAGDRPQSGRAVGARRSSIFSR